MRKKHSIHTHTATRRMIQLNLNDDQMLPSYGGICEYACVA